MRKVWERDKLSLTDAGVSPRELVQWTNLSLLVRDFQLHQYCGFTAATGLDNTDQDYHVMIKKGLFGSLQEYIRHQSPDGGEDTEFLEVDLPNREEGLRLFTVFVDRYYRSHPGG
jgi:hypothetical protein